MDSVREDCLVRSNKKKCIKRQAFSHRVGASLYETTLRLLLISPGRVKSDWLDVTNAQKLSMISEAENKELDENFGLQGQQTVP